MFTNFFVKLIGLCQRLQIWTDFDEVFRNYPSNCGVNIVSINNIDICYDYLGQVPQY